MEPPETPAVMVRCAECGKMVPEMNMTIHKVRACEGRARRPLNTPSTPAPPNTEEIDNTVPMDIDEVEAIEVDANDGETPSDDFGFYNQQTPTATSTLRRRRGSSRREIGDNTTISNEMTRPGNDNNIDNGDDLLEVGDVIDLTATPPPQQQQQQPASNESNNNNNTSDEHNEEWACPKCTLLNPRTESLCGACRYRNPDIVRPPDDVHVERLVDSMFFGDGLEDDQIRELYNFNSRNDSRSSSSNENNPDSPSSPMLYLSGGALLGGMLGAAGSMFQGRSMVSGAAEGAMSGAVGGAFLQDFLRSGSNQGSRRSVRERARDRQTQRRSSNNIAQARSSAAMGMAGYPSIDTTTSDDEEEDHADNQQRERNRSSFARQQPRSSYRVVQRQRRNPSASGNASFTTTTIISGGNGTTRIIRRSNGGGRTTTTTTMGSNTDLDPLMSLLMHSQGEMMMGSREGVPSSYEQLLEAFGDGTENLGASEDDIQRLPTTTVEQPRNMGAGGEDNDNERTQCQICLEDYEAGDSKKTLPCLHGFHTTCVDKWLRSNGCCPICKHRISS